MLAKGIEKYLPARLREELEKNPAYGQAEELRIRAGSRVMFYAQGREHILDYRIEREQVGELAISLAEHSLHTFLDEIRQGYFTVGQGVRVGVAGKVVSEREQVSLIRNYTSLAIRFPREWKGIHSGLFPYLMQDGRVVSTLLLSAPQHGKTTLLRDLVRAVSSGELYEPKKCTVVDERGELSGGGYFDLGERTDVLSGCPKSQGLMMALRALSPEVLATDEIGSEGDLSAIKEVANAGVILLATAHGSSLEELKERLFFKSLLETGIMRRVVLLSESLGRGTVEAVYDGRGRALLAKPFLLSPQEGRLGNAV